MKIQVLTKLSTLRGASKQKGKANERPTFSLLWLFCRESDERTPARLPTTCLQEKKKGLAVAH